MPGDKDFNKGRGPVEDYKTSITYRMIQDDIRNSELERALKFVRSLSGNEAVDSKHLSMMDVLLQAYRQGDRSDKLIEQFKTAVDSFFKELAEKGMISSGGQKSIESVEVQPEEPEDDDEEGEEWKKGR